MTEWIGQRISSSGGNTPHQIGVVDGMARAMWNGTVIAESDDTVIVDDNHYFPVSSVTAELRESTKNTVCSWKGTASYYTLVVDGVENRDAVWYYTTPSDAAAEIAGRVAFWRGVTVEA